MYTISEFDNIEACCGRIVGKCFEGVSLFFEPLKRFGQGGAQFIDALKGVVKSYDGAVTGVAFHIMYNVVGCE